jgi:mono/diheme cytochrome c family protein
MKRRYWIIAIGALLAIPAGALGFIYLGIYSVAATGQHTAPVYWLTETVMRFSIANHARGTQVPDLDGAARIERGLGIYVEHCEPCHGGPGVAPAPFALGMTPVPANLVETGRRWPAADIHWAIKYGIKMTGMPAWKYRMSEESIWDAVAFIERLPYLSHVEYQRLRENAAHQHGHTGLGESNRQRGETAVRP